MIARRTDRPPYRHFGFPSDPPPVPTRLRQLELAGGIVTADALHCQKEPPRKTTEADARPRACPQRRPRYRPWGDPGCCGTAPLATIEIAHDRWGPRRSRLERCFRGLADRVLLRIDEGGPTLEAEGREIRALIAPVRRAGLGNGTIQVDDAVADEVPVARTFDTRRAR